VAWLTVVDLAWNALLQRSAWINDTLCRHTRDSENLVVLHIYGYRVKSLTSARGLAWAPAKPHPRSFDAVIARARAASAAAGLPEYKTFGDDVPFFIRPEDDKRERDAVHRRERGGASR
jgi:hypothetical protein